jgi:FKBP-type peptidyl-prolyl cis-trans isomerase SlyD
MSGKKRMISVTFTGKELLEGKVFDTNSEKDAKEAGIHDEKKKYKPLTIITGENELMPLVEKELMEMKAGEEKVVKLIAKDAFGERSTELLRVVPLQNFIDQKINPYPGLVIRIGNAFGRVQSVGSGRVRVDFNHPLSGRDVEYKVRVEKEFQDKKEISEEIFSKYYERIPGTEKEIAGDTLTITLEGEAFSNLTKVNEAIKKLSEELGIKLDIKESKKLSEGKSIEVDKEEHEHVHGPNCNHDHEHVHEAQKGKIIDGDAVTTKTVAEKSINQIAKEVKSEKKSTSGFNVTKDSATTIQRPKKMQ